MFSPKRDGYTTPLEERIVSNFIYVYLPMYVNTYLKARVHRGQMKVSKPQKLEFQVVLRLEI